MSLRPRIIEFDCIEAVFRYARLVLLYSGTRVMFVLPNAVVAEYNGLAVYIVSREGGYP